ncbi:SGNH/GDSL hydrolase family protein [Paenibacillus sp. GD4]|jgi:lysophospholipase L1-like esterase|uniref:SGNH/GDSL hydrolase family protein n=1 Tax=Paenibacillus sp. GD4 TaxID=3068890 RepID=UPI002796433E|nr:SGNH/GDSL hydrolase family protein [Paenibacillus sp. GD4]MDQ1912688.1 SGNH/GDSL hydrolase family protein [Paenibacillus sp. GD4]
MLWNNMELHNVAEVEANELTPGLTLQRYPRHVREALSERGRFIAQQASGCEIRFVTEAANLRVGLTAVEGDGDVMVFQGDFFHSHHRLQAGVLHTLHLERKLDLSKVEPKVLEGQRFSPKVWRLFLCRYTARFHGLEAFGHEVRPPATEELPARRWIAYGSSITHGGIALNNYHSYIQLAARRLGVDVLNLGLSGACLCEPAVSDYLSSRVDWDFATLELGVNMRGSFTPEQFRERAEYLIESICSKHPKKPVAVITVYPNGATYETTPSIAGQNQAAYSDILRELVQSSKHQRLYLLEGSDILPGFSGLAWDLLHPSDYGHMLMGEHISRHLRAIIGS